MQSNQLFFLERRNGRPWILANLLYIVHVQIETIESDDIMTIKWGILESFTGCINQVELTTDDCLTISYNKGSIHVIPVFLLNNIDQSFYLFSRKKEPFLVGPAPIKE